MEAGGKAPGKFLITPLFHVELNDFLNREGTSILFLN